MGVLYDFQTGKPVEQVPEPKPFSLHGEVNPFIDLRGAIDSVKDRLSNGASIAGFALVVDYHDTPEHGDREVSFSATLGPGHLLSMAHALLKVGQEHS